MTQKRAGLTVADTVTRPQPKVHALRSHLLGGGQAARGGLNRVGRRPAAAAGVVRLLVRLAGGKPGRREECGEEAEGE